MKIRKVMSCIVTVILFTACSSDIESNMSAFMTEFEFITQDEETLSLEDLKDDWWIANFAYTNCRTVCPRTTANMVNVQNKLKKDELKPLQMVTFSIDPLNDTSEVLKEYAQKYEVDLDTWDFLTGYDFKTIQNISEKTFKAPLEEGALGQKSHGYGVYLINPNAEIIKKYDGMSSEELDTLAEDIKTVLSK